MYEDTLFAHKAVHTAIIISIYMSFSTNRVLQFIAVNPLPPPSFCIDSIIQFQEDT